MTTPTTWVWNDTSIPDTDSLLRRLPRKPDFVTPDLITGEHHVHPAAFKHDPDDGMSVHREGLIALAGIALQEICNWSTHTAVRFPVAAPRSTAVAGVIDKPDPDDDCLGSAHSLVRCAAPVPNRATWRQIRTAIMEVAHFVGPPQKNMN